MRYRLLIIVSVLISACAQNDNEISGPLFCQIDQTETYNLGTSPSSDFNVTNLSKDIVFNSTDCPQINEDSFSQFVSRVKRVDNQLQIFENQYQSSQFLLEMEISGSTLRPVKDVTNLNTCSIVRVWRGSLNPATNTVSINQVIEYKGVCQSLFYNPETDTTNPGS